MYKTGSWGFISPTAEVSGVEPAFLDSDGGSVIYKLCCLGDASHRLEAQLPVVKWGTESNPWECLMVEM